MKKNRILQFLAANGFLLIIGLAVLVNFSFFFSLQPWDENVVSKTVMSGDDAPGYYRLATTLLTDHSFENFGTLRTPGYPLFIALVFGVFGKHVWVILLIQLLLNELKSYINVVL